MDNDQLKKEIAEFINGLECSKNLNCYRSGLENLCKARDIGLEQFLECLEENGHNCPFSIPFGKEGYFCKCTPRIYLAKKLKKYKK
jgi:hypothetical protein